MRKITVSITFTTMVGQSHNFMKLKWSKLENVGWLSLNRDFSVKLPFVRALGTDVSCDENKDIDRLCSRKSTPGSD